MTGTVVILRPQPGADATAREARAHGLHPILYPLFKVEPLGWTPPEAQEFDAVMFTSANAARHGGPALAAYHALPVFAVGLATARAAAEQGFASVRAEGPDAGATALALARAGHSKVLHIRGEDTRAFDPAGLNVTSIPVYRAIPVGDAAGLAAMLEPGAVILVHSPRAAAHLAELVAPPSRSSLAIVAISPAALQAAGDGWAKARAAETPQDAAMLALARQICEEGSSNQAEPTQVSDMNSEFAAASSHLTLGRAPSRSRWMLVIVLLLAFVGGVFAALSVAPALRDWWSGTGSGEGADNASLSAYEAMGAGTPSVNAPTPATVAALEARMAAISTRLDGISEEAAAAGGNAARAEGLLIAFATRRALDHGTPLGYLEGELNLRFGNAQPRAVATIITAAHSPVTLSDLQAGLEAIAPALIGTQGETDWWAAAKREFSNLIIIRKADTPSPVPQKAIERARLMLAADRVDSALKEVERLPNHEIAENWIQRARQYNEARRALDVIEAAAILEPRSVPASRAGGQTNMQVAPPPPAVPRRTPTPPAP